MKFLIAENGGLDLAKETLLNGELVVVPTETVCGVAALATNARAMEKLSTLKERPADQAFSLMVYDVEEAKKLWLPGPERDRALLLIAKFCPGPLTIVAPFNIASGLEPRLFPQGTVGIRIPRHAVLLQLLQAVRFPLAVPSANLRGAAPPTLIRDVCLPEVMVALDADCDQQGLPSTVAQVFRQDLKVLREGAISKEELLAAIS
ncbi:MAG: threonylcarbamoyl-AMP synthase [Deltaproteobacteria bacterium]|nr:threonylcarbamoyl-AMP synthase [Deltaproteobacteria bacterium]